MRSRWVVLLAILLGAGCATPKIAPSARMSLIGTGVAGSVTHAHVCSQAATPSSTDVDCPDWNDSHVFGGTAAADGKFPYYDAGEATHLNWTAALLWDETALSIKFGGGTLGTNASRVFSAGCASTVVPTTSPADTIQWWCKDVGGAAGKAGWFLLDEEGTTFFIGDNLIGTSSASDLGLATVGTERVHFDQVGNMGLGTATFGTTAVRNFVLFSGTAPTTSPADSVAIWAEDRNGAGTASPKVRNEEGMVEALGTLVHARSTNEASVTNGTSDLHTLNTGINIPTTDGAVIRFSWRKSGAGTGTVSIGLKINTTQIINNGALTASDANAYNGYCEITVWNRAANFLRSLKATCWNNTNTQTAVNLFASADMANAAITDIRITGVGSAANVTLGVRDVVVMRLAGF